MYANFFFILAINFQTTSSPPRNSRPTVPTVISGHEIREESGTTRTERPPISESGETSLKVARDAPSVNERIDELLGSTSDSDDDDEYYEAEDGNSTVIFGIY